MKETKNLDGKKPCIHKKTFYGMVGGRCVKCGGWLSSLGQHPSISTNHRVSIYKDILEIIKINSPYYERDDKDDYVYILKKYHTELIADKLCTYFATFMSTNKDGLK